MISYVKSISYMFSFNNLCRGVLYNRTVQLAILLHRGIIILKKKCYS